MISGSSGLPSSISAGARDTDIPGCCNSVGTMPDDRRFFVSKAIGWARDLTRLDPAAVAGSSKHTPTCPPWLQGGGQGTCPGDTADRLAS